MADMESMGHVSGVWRRRRREGLAAAPDAEHVRDAAVESGGLGGAATRGVLWMTVQKWITRLGGLATVALLTRVLDPADFGTVSAAMSVLPMVYLLSDVGLSTYVVQVDAPSERALRTAFWFSLGMGVILFAALYLCAPLFAAAFGIPGVTTALRWMAPAILMVSLSSVSIALLRRRLMFRELAQQTAVASLAAQVVAVVLALNGAGVGALVGQLLVSMGVGSVLAIVRARWWPRWGFSLIDLRVMAGFGSQVVVVELVAVARAWGETAIIASVLGATGLGYLSIAKKLIETVQDLSASAIFPVATVVFAKTREDVEHLRSAYHRALSACYTTVSLPLGLVVAAGPLIVPVLFGGGWGTSAGVAQVLALAAVFTMGATLDHGLFYGVGKPGNWLWYSVVIDGLTLAVTALTVRWGLLGVACGFALVAFGATVLRWFLVARLLETRATNIATPLVRAAPIMIGSTAVGLLVVVLTSGFDDLLRLVLVGVAMSLVQVVLAILVEPAVAVDLLRGLRVGRIAPGLVARVEARLPATAAASEG
ncbi:oligosaccharide flippase family protein [Cellulomonas citrea]|uniref:oligosaccharide flippase family protein n=1 Tax=Cellulomonas citrea TaxID=1909423 RepID=UPI002E2D50E1|nr:oligosaccharide flippase family protein [Cellulomonas citrea]